MDPISGEPEFKHTPARVEPFVVSWYGFALSRRELALKDLSWWACATGPSFLRYELAGRRVPGERCRWAQQLLRADTADWIEYEDVAAGTYRAVELHHDRIESCLFVAARPQLPSREWLAGLFAKSVLSDADRASVLAGRARDPGADTGAVVCSCHSVGRRAIEAAIGSGGQDPAAIGKLTRAGTHCGSCVPELRRIIAETREVTA